MEQLMIKEVGQIAVAKDKREFFPVVFSAGFGQKDRVRNIFQDFKRDAKGNPTEERIWNRGTREQAIALMQAKTPIAGSIVTRKVKSYRLNETGPELNTYTTVLFPGENEVSVFAGAGHNIVTEDGEILGKEKVSIASAPAVAEATAESVTA